METELLQAYRELLLRQFDAHPGYTHRVVVDRDVSMFDQMVMEDLILRETVAAAIAFFIAHRAWPELSDETRFYLSLRFHCGLIAIDALLGVPPRPLSEGEEASLQTHAHEFGDSPVILNLPSQGAPVTFNPPAPSPCNEPAFLHWLLILLWEPLGPVWIMIFSDAWAKGKRGLFVK